MNTLDYANLLATFVSLSLIAGSVFVFRNNPAALVFLPFLAIGGPIEALLYDLGVQRKPLELYPFSLTNSNSIYALGCVLLVLSFLLIWFYGSPRLVNDVFCHRLRLWALIVFFAFELANVGQAVRHWETGGARGTNTLVYDPGESFMVSSAPLWAVATAVLVVVTGNRVVSALVLAVYVFTSLWGSGFERGEVVACLLTLFALKIERLRPALAVGLVATGLLAASIGALTRGTDDASGSKVANQALADVQFLDQTVSYVDRCEGDLWRPRAPTAFAESFVYGFMPRFIFRDKPAVYGNHTAEAVLAPVTVANDKTLARTGASGGFFPIATWIEMFYDFGLLFGIIGFFVLALVLRSIAHASRTNIYAWLFTILTVSVSIGFFRGGSNWLMMELKATVLFAATYAPIEWLLRRRIRLPSSAPLPAGVQQRASSVAGSR